MSQASNLRPRFFPNPPLIAQQGGEVIFLKQSGGIVVGAIEDLTFKTKRLVLQPGDSLFMYTDGVTEAINEREELFSEERLKNEIITLQEKSIQELVLGITQEIKVFSHGMPQADDITMLILRFMGSQE